MSQADSVNIAEVNKTEAIEPVSLSQSACHYVQQKLNQRSKGIGIRLAVKSAGCSGLKYVIDYQDELTTEDYCFPTQDKNIYVFVDKKSYPFVKGTEINYIEDKFNSHFEFNNPHMTSACGCGESFSIEEAKANQL